MYVHLYYATLCIVFLNGLDLPIRMHCVGSNDGVNVVCETSQKDRFYSRIDFGARVSPVYEFGGFV